MRRRRIIFALGVLASIFSFWPGTTVPVAIQRELFESLRTTAGIIFGVMGVWVALLYPDARNAVMKRGRAETEEERRVGRLLQPMLIATVVLGAVLLYGPASEIARTFPLLHHYVEELRGASFVLLVLLTFTLFWSVLLTLRGILYVREDTENVRKQKEAVATLRQVG